MCIRDRGFHVRFRPFGHKQPRLPYGQPLTGFGFQYQYQPLAKQFGQISDILRIEALCLEKDLQDKKTLYGFPGGQVDRQRRHLVGQDHAGNVRIEFLPALRAHFRAKLLIDLLLGDDLANFRGGWQAQHLSLIHIY